MPSRSRRGGNSPRRDLSRRVHAAKRFHATAGSASPRRSTGRTRQEAQRAGRRRRPRRRGPWLAGVAWILLCPGWTMITPTPVTLVEPSGGLPCVGVRERGLLRIALTYPYPWRGRLPWCDAASALRQGRHGPRAAPYRRASDPGSQRESCCVNNRRAVSSAASRGRRRPVAMWPVSRAMRHQCPWYPAKEGAERPRRPLRRGWSGTGACASCARSCRAHALHAPRHERRTSYVRDRAHSPVLRRRRGPAACRPRFANTNLLVERGRLPYGLGGTHGCAPVGESRFLVASAILGGTVRPSKGAERQCERMACVISRANIVGAATRRPYASGTMPWVARATGRRSRKRRGVGCQADVEPLRCGGQFSSEMPTRPWRVDARPCPLRRLLHDETLA